MMLQSPGIHAGSYARGERMSQAVNEEWPDLVWDNNRPPRSSQLVSVQGLRQSNQIFWSHLDYAPPWAVNLRNK